MLFRKSLMNDAWKDLHDIEGIPAGNILLQNVLTLLIMYKCSEFTLKASLRLGHF